jgi:hypothetical protein
MRRSSAFKTAVIVLVMSLPTAASAQRREATQAGQAPVVIEAKIGGKSYQARGSGECKHEPNASIRGTSAALWMVQYAGQSGKLKNLHLTLWRPKDGGQDQLSIALDAGSATHRIQTGGSEENVGSGTVTILPSGPGGRLEISGKEAEGKSVKITIDCTEFAGVQAEGG